MPREPRPPPAVRSPSPGAPLAEQARRGLATLDPGILIDDLHSSHAAPGEIAGLAPHFNVSRVDDSRLAMLGRLLIRCAPFASDPPLQLGVHTPDPGFEVRGKRDLVLATLADHGQAGFFDELAARNDPANHDTIKPITIWPSVALRERGSAHEPPSPIWAAVDDTSCQSTGGLYRRERSAAADDISPLECAPRRRELADEHHDRQARARQRRSKLTVYSGLVGARAGSTPQAPTGSRPGARWTVSMARVIKSSSAPSTAAPARPSRMLRAKRRVMSSTDCDPAG
jgi:hypothetical protein